MQSALRCALACTLALLVVSQELSSAEEAVLEKRARSFAFAKRARNFAFAKRFDPYPFGRSSFAFAKRAAGGPVEAEGAAAEPALDQPDTAEGAAAAEKRALRSFAFAKRARNFAFAKRSLSRFAFA